MKAPRFVGLTILCLSLSLLGPPAAMAQQLTLDPMQRYFIFRNDAPFPIYPVISAPKNANCSRGDLTSLRIVVNDGQKGAGIAHGKTVKVVLPKEYPCKNGGFYNASRIYVLLAKFSEFDELLKKNPGTVGQGTDPVADAPTDLCPENGNACWIGEAKQDYVGDFPGQLLEYTIISQIGSSASPNGPNDPKGVSVIDFDVSYVDDAYLPVAMELDNGMTAFMGSSLGYDEFKRRLTTFVSDSRTQWSAYNVYAQRNWEKQTVFGPGQSPALNLDKIDKLPSGNVVVVSSRAASVGFSPYFANDNSAVPPDNYKFPACNDGTHNLACNHFDHNPTGDCCPTSNGVNMLGCCDVKNFLVDNTLATFIKAGEKDGKPIPIYDISNPTFTNMVNRWQQWRERAYNCGANPPATPATDAAGFCSAFKKTIDFVWGEFLGNCLGLRGEALDQCLTAAILGYDLKAADPQKCEKCPALPCPAECVVDIQRNESVQALLRSVPWTPAGDPSKCGKCPSPNGQDCPLECVAPPVYSPNATLWHRDKFLHFWAPYESPYNLNPFARFVHKDVPDTHEGLAAPGAYSFSIDDFYGNYGGPGTTLIINVGGTSGLVNRSPFDPYTQYFVGVPAGWHSAEVCGRQISLPDPSTGLAANVPFSFWKADGSGKQASCEITVYADATKQEYVKFKLDEVSYTVRDTYTGQDHPETLGLSGVYAVRQGQLLNPPDNPYCCQNSTKNLAGRGKCQANLSPGFLNLAYVAVTECSDPNSATCGRPLMTLNVPGPSGGAPDTSCKSVSSDGTANDSDPDRGGRQRNATPEAGGRERGNDGRRGGATGGLERPAEDPAGPARPRR